ncbi:MAG: LemA family protein [Acidaminococcus provencensis]|jgi:LemA protein|uniref:LemA family protein n=1 Tax=Acidaminococcus TaxID=904 RepID=UPI000E51110A|nr:MULTISPECIES: LemA family protein [Acidaminococcus]MCH4096519.1 LemA family protein [Acidaminococcus provencensis]RHK01012.1 LemA family protein [Acidaminococcus sp. AM05-11]
MKKVLIGILVVLLLCAGWIFGSYNGLVSANENVNGKWSQVETQLQRRSDLIPNLVNTVKGYSAHESQVFTDVANARAKLAGAQNVADTAQASGELSSALTRLLALQENYPNLKANTNFLQLQDELAGTENRLAVARKDYNDAAQAYNAKIKSFPTVIIANMMGFTSRSYFQADQNAQAAPQVKF